MQHHLPFDPASPENLDIDAVEKYLTSLSTKDLKDLCSSFGAPSGSGSRSIIIADCIDHILSGGVLKYQSQIENKKKVIKEKILKSLKSGMKSTSEILTDISEGKEGFFNDYSGDLIFEVVRDLCNSKDLVSVTYYAISE